MFIPYIIDYREFNSCILKWKFFKTLSDVKTTFHVKSACFLLNDNLSAPKSYNVKNLNAGRDSVIANKLICKSLREE